MRTLPKPPDTWDKLFFRCLLLADMALVGFFFYAGSFRELQYVTKALCGYGGAVLFIVSLLFLTIDRRYACAGLGMGSLSIFLGLLPTLA